MTQEYKAAVPTSDLNSAFDAFMRSFDQFKAANDERLGQLERKNASDVITNEKVERINAAVTAQQRVLDQLAVTAGRPPVGGEIGAHSPERYEQKAQFDAFMRRGTLSPSSMEHKALSVGTGSDGGYLVPDETEQTVMMRLRDVSPIRAIAGQRDVTGTVFKKPFSITGPGTGWVSETAARPETTSPSLAELSFPTMELYAMPAASASLLDDSAVDIDTWIAQEVELAFAEQETAAFVNGNGTTQPKGLLTYPVVDQASWTWGNLGSVSTGAAGAFASAPLDTLIDTIYSVNAAYRSNGHWLMNRRVQSELRKVKDADGNYIWQPALTPNAMPTLLNYPVAECEDMPDLGADSLSIAFGDFNRGYLIVDRIGLRILRDPYSSKPYVLFYTTKRVGGGVQDFNAIKLIKFGS